MFFTAFHKAPGSKDSVRNDSLQPGSRILETAGIFHMSTAFFMPSDNNKSKKWFNMISETYTTEYINSRIFPKHWNDIF